VHLENILGRGAAKSGVGVKAVEPWIALSSTNVLVNEFHSVAA